MDARIQQVEGIIAQLQQRLVDEQNARAAVAQQLADEQQARQTLEAAVQAGQTPQAAINTQQAAATAGTGTTGTRRVGVDTRNLGRPESFNGDDSRWRDWAVVFRSYAGLVTPELGQLMTDAERLDRPAYKATLTPPQQEAANDLYHLLLHLTKSSALDRVVNAGPGEGLEAWRSLVQRYDPRVRSRAAGQLLEIPKWDFTGDLMMRLESFERAITDWQTASTDVLSDTLRIGIVLNRVTDTELAAHLLFQR